VQKKIYVAGPSITEREVELVAEATASGWYENAFSHIEQFEQNFKKYVGRKYAIAMPSCTSSIHISLLALGIQPGDEIIVPDITWIATASPISYLGATPVFADMDKTSWCISLDSIKKCITNKTKALIFVDLYGNMPELDEILEFAKSKNIKALEDSAQALGSEYKGKKAGSFGDISVFSFHGTKILTTGEGGMILTDDEKLYKRCLKLRDLGRSDSGKLFWNDEVAHKYKMSNIQAALGIAQLERFEEILAYKRETFAWYSEELSDMPGIYLNKTPEYAKSNYWMNTILWEPSIYPVQKEDVMSIMKEKWNIDTRPFFYPLSSMPAYENLSSQNYSLKNKASYELSPYGINLPSSMKNDKEAVKFAARKFKETLGSFMRGNT
jgi:perosamine synthetase